MIYFMHYCKQQNILAEIYTKCKWQMRELDIEAFKRVSIHRA